MNKILYIITALVGIFTFGVIKGKNNEKSKQASKSVKKLRQANKIRKDVDKISASDLNDTYDKL